MPVKRRLTKKPSLQGLYDREINFRLSCFWDGGIDWELGDFMNGVKDAGGADTVKEAVDDLWAAAKKVYPGAFT